MGYQMRMSVTGTKGLPLSYWLAQSWNHPEQHGLSAFLLAAELDGETPLLKTAQRRDTKSNFD